MDRTAQWHGVGGTDIGLIRPTNQDAFLIADELGVWIVADGMSGQAGGDVASQTAVEAIQGSVMKRAGRSAPPKTEEIPVFLQSVIGEANEAVCAYARANPEYTGMGTTVVLCFRPVPSSPLAWIAHAGDSRAYLIREQRMAALTRDHTVLEERIQQGFLPESTSARHPLGHVLTRGIGIHSTIEADVSMITLQAQDEILLCSDGLNKALNDDQILDVLRTERTATKQCLALIEQANLQGGPDNTTVLLITAGRSTAD